MPRLWEAYQIRKKTKGRGPINHLGNCPWHVRGVLGICYTVIQPDWFSKAHGPVLWWFDYRE